MCLTRWTTTNTFNALKVPWKAQSYKDFSLRGAGMWCRPRDFFMGEGLSKNIRVRFLNWNRGSYWAGYLRGLLSFVIITLKPICLFSVHRICWWYCSIPVVWVNMMGLKVAPLMIKWIVVIWFSGMCFSKGATNTSNRVILVAVTWINRCGLRGKPLIW